MAYRFSVVPLACAVNVMKGGVAWRIVPPTPTSHMSVPDPAPQRAAAWILLVVLVVYPVDVHSWPLKCARYPLSPAAKTSVVSVPVHDWMSLLVKSGA